LTCDICGGIFDGILIKYHDILPNMPITAIQVKEAKPSDLTSEVMY
jgi:hypothetical protein